MKKMYHKGNSSTLNIFTAGYVFIHCVLSTHLIPSSFNSTDKSLGYASLPSAYFREPLKDGLMIRYTTLPGGSHKNYNLGRTTVHELGHWLGLYHTFEVRPPLPYLERVLEIYGNAAGWLHWRRRQCRRYTSRVVWCRRMSNRKEVVS